MQDIDFGRFYRQNKRATLSEITQARNKKNKSFLSRNTVLAALSLGLFFTGVVFGIRWEKYSYTRQIESETLGHEMSTANVPPTKGSEIQESIKIDKAASEKIPVEQATPEQPSAKQVQQAISDNKEAYLILAKMYQDEKDAYVHGRELQKQGLPVFLARSGKKVKVYVGPIEGKNTAYQFLARVKGIPEFHSAIMYKK